jgi:hypothetical protein
MITNLLQRSDDFLHVDQLTIVRIEREVHLDSTDFIPWHVVHCAARETDSDSALNGDSMHSLTQLFRVLFR